MMRMLSTVLIALAFTAGCSKKKTEPKTDPAPTDPAPKTTETPTPTPTDPAAPPAADPAAPPAPAAGAFDAAKAEALQNEMVGVFEKAGKDCAKLATDMNAFLEKNKDALAQMDAAEKAMTDADKKAWEEKQKAWQAASEKKMEASLTACKDDPKVQEVMAKIPE